MHSIGSLTKDLTTIWISWLQYHEVSVDTSRPIADRRVAGENCNNLLIERARTINQINEEFERYINENKGQGNKGSRTTGNGRRCQCCS